MNIDPGGGGVNKLLKGPKTEKATGTESIPPFVHKTAADEITPVPTRLFQVSIDTGEVPSDWKAAWEKDGVRSYRPVSLTFITCKVLEHIVHSTIMNHFDNNKVLRNSQHGFRCMCSCESQLVVTEHEIANQLTAGH